ncbi:MAG: hypothetical protein IKU19_09050 [Clostridia bacterium]|nr:hypothetical protein [Clostridia bacterium]
MGYDKYRSLLSYRYGQLKENGLWNIAMRAVRYTRRYFLISRLIRYASYIIAAIETSAVLIVVFTALVILLPIALLLFGITVVLSVSQYKKYNRLISEDIKDRKLVIIDAKKGYFRKTEAYLNNMAKCFRNEGYTVLVISHSFVCDAFLVARKAEDNIWVLKLNYFFILKKQLMTDDITYIY